MPKAVNTGLPIVGIIFFLLGIVKFLQGKPAVVWLILAVVFGVLGVFNRPKSGGSEQ